MEVLGCVVIFFYDENFSPIFFFLGDPEFFSPWLSYFLQRLASSFMTQIKSVLCLKKGKVSGVCTSKEEEFK